MQTDDISLYDSSQFIRKKFFFNNYTHTKNKPKTNNSLHQSVIKLPQIQTRQI